MNRKSSLLLFSGFLFIGCGVMQFGPIYIPPPPTIEEVSDDAAVQGTRPVTVSAEIKAHMPPLGIDRNPLPFQNSICRAYLFYQAFKGDAAPWKAVPMKRTEEADTFQAIIPGFEEHTQVRYRIMAMDCFFDEKAGINNNIALESRAFPPGAPIVFGDRKDYLSVLFGEIGENTLPPHDETTAITGESLPEDLDILDVRVTKDTADPAGDPDEDLRLQMKVQGEIVAGSNDLEGAYGYIFLIQNQRRPDDPTTDFVNEGTFALLQFSNASQTGGIIPTNSSLIDVEATQKHIDGNRCNSLAPLDFVLFLGVPVFRAHESCIVVNEIAFPGQQDSNPLVSHLPIEPPGTLGLTVELDDLEVTPSPNYDPSLGDFIISAATGILLDPSSNTKFIFQDLTNSIRLYFRPPHRYSVGQQEEGGG